MTSHPFAFRSLAGVEPGVTTLNDVQDRFGDPDSQSLTQSSNATGGDPGGDLIWHYPLLGVQVYIGRDDTEALNPLVDEVHIIAPFDQPLRCGLHIGQSLESARKVIQENFQVTDEYEDAIYFVPAIGYRLLASVENLNTNKVVKIELMRHHDGNAE
ncbi:MAG: hypothetical protein AAF604_02010 [Acidobacteriota bacterium]